MDKPDGDGGAGPGEPRLHGHGAVDEHVQTRREDRLGVEGAGDGLAGDAEGLLVDRQPVAGQAQPEAGGHVEHDLVADAHAGRGGEGQLRR